jgi:predicted DNA-binding ribbon-helix-helix protein
MSVRQHLALASLEAAGAARQSRRVRHPRTGRSCTITLEAVFWQHLDALARQCGTTTAGLCRTALLESPDSDPAEALWRLLWFAYIRPNLPAPPKPDVH